MSGWELPAILVAVALALIGALVWQARKAGSSGARAAAAEEDRDAQADALGHHCDVVVQAWIDAQD
jgi:hypothetical protein